MCRHALADFMDALIAASLCVSASCAAERRLKLTGVNETSGIHTPFPLLLRSFLDFAVLA